jgi:hypothetical protein
VESNAIAAARRSALLGRRFVDCVDTVILCLAAITVSLESVSCESRAFARYGPTERPAPASTAIRTSVGVSADPEALNAWTTSSSRSRALMRIAAVDAG